MHCTTLMLTISRNDLPPKEKFFSSLNDNGISDRNCKHAQIVWNAFKGKDNGNYVFLYNVQDVLTSLTVDIDLMKTVSAKCNLNHLNYVMLALFSWECTLKITKMELELQAMLTRNSKSLLSLVIGEFAISYICYWLSK